MEKLDAALLREVSTAEIQQELGLITMHQIQDFQTKIADERGLDPIARITEDRLFPPEAVEEHGRDKLLGLLACNTSMYDDDIEDTIDADPLAQAIIHMKLSDPNNTERYTRALRVRRSVIALLQDQVVIDLTSVPNTKHTPSSAA